MAQSGLFEMMYNYDSRCVGRYESEDGKVMVSTALVTDGRKPYETAIRHITGCTVIALQEAEGLYINPDPALPLAADAEMILIGTAEGERQFLQRFGRRDKIYPWVPRPSRGEGEG